MADYKHILLTTDLSHESDFLGRRAVALAKTFNAKLSLVHVVEHSPMVYGSGEFAIPLDLDLEETLEKQAQETLDKQAKKLKVKSSDAHLVVGACKDQIVKLAGDVKIDLILVGAHDKHGLALLLGSTADSILHALPCDVLCIKVEDE